MAVGSGDRLKSRLKIVNKFLVLVCFSLLASCGKRVPVPQPGTYAYVNQWLIEKESMPDGCASFRVHASRADECVANFNHLVEGREEYATRVDPRGRDVKFGEFRYFGPELYLGIDGKAKDGRTLPDGTFEDGGNYYYGYFNRLSGTVYYGNPAVLKHEIKHALDYRLNPTLITPLGNYRFAVVNSSG